MQGYTAEIPLTNLEDHSVVKSPMNLSYHSPLLEVRDYKQQMIEISCRDQYNHTLPSYVEENWDLATISENWKEIPSDWESNEENWVADYWNSISEIQGN